MLPEEVSAKILVLVEKRRKSLRDIAIEFFNKYREYSFMKPLVRVLTLNTLRQYLFLDYLLSEAGIQVSRENMYRKWLLRILAYSLTLGRDNVKISRINKIIDKHGLPREVLGLKSIDYEEVRRHLVRVGRLDIAFSFPKWLLNYIVRARIPFLEKFLEELLKDPVVWIRVSSHRIRRSDLVKLLNKEGFIVEEDRDLDDCIRVIKGSRGLLAKTRLYELGYYVIQDKASLLASHILVNSIDVKDKIVLDVASGAGLKASHLVQLGVKKMIAQDLSFNMLNNGLLLVKRLGLNGKALFIAADSTYGLPISILREIDGILIDPPCSSIGRMALQPELKLHLTKTKFKELIRLQYRLLKNIISNAKRGTKILYSTCTITLEENEELVRIFEKEGYVELINQKPFIGSRSFIEPRIQRLYPHLHKTQGFTITLMEVV